MRTREVIKRIRKAAKGKGLSFALDRNGSNHDVSTLDGLMIPVPRHSEVGNLFAEKVSKECEPKLGEGWWK